MVPGEIEDNAAFFFWRGGGEVGKRGLKKVHYGRCANGDSTEGNC